CDPAESCQAGNPNCPPDVVNPVTTTCGTQSTCEADHCSGVDGTCVQSFKTGVCRPSTGVCDPAESCQPGNPNCPADVFSPASTACGTQGTCEADHCSAVDATCVTSFKPPTTQCGNQTVCESDHCSGTDSTCVPGFKPPSTSCNAALCQFCDGA